MVPFAAQYDKAINTNRAFIINMSSDYVPDLIVFDLDRTVWSSSSRNGAPTDVRLLPGAKSILDTIPTLKANNATMFAVASNNTNWGKSILQQFQIAHLFDYIEIHSGSKVVHFKYLRRKSGVPFNRMLFFDDRKEITDAVSNLGVLAVHCPCGLQSTNIFLTAMKEYSRWHTAGCRRGVVVAADGKLHAARGSPVRSPAANKAEWRRSPFPRPSLMAEVVKAGYNIMQRTQPENWCTKANQDWRASFGAGPSSVAIAWQMIDPLNNPGIPNSPQLHHLLWALKFMKTYETDRNLASNLGGKDVKTPRKWVKPFVKEIARLCEDLVSGHLFFRRYNVHYYYCMAMA